MLRTTLHIKCDAIKWPTLGPYRRLRKLLSGWYRVPEHSHGKTKDQAFSWLSVELSDDHRTTKHLEEVSSHLDQYLTLIADERSRAHPSVLQILLITTGTNGHEKANFTRRFHIDSTLLLKLAGAGIEWDLEVCPSGGGE